MSDRMEELVAEATVKAARRKLDSMSLEERLALREAEAVPLDDPPADDSADLVRQIRRGN